jgi:hypothetical protein
MVSLMALLKILSKLENVLTYWLRESMKKEKGFLLWTTGVNYIKQFLAPLVISVCDSIISSITLKSSIIFLETLFKLIYDVYSRGITFDNRQLIINRHSQYVYSTGHWTSCFNNLKLFLHFLNSG